MTPPRTLALLPVLALAIVAVAVALAKPPEERPREPRAAAARFLDRYVTAGGRVVRHDEGGDTVSEGQAYAMLLSAATGDRRRFARVWGWTRRNLQRPDGLLSWRWAGGRVTGSEPAADADLDAARALLVAARRFRLPGYRREAARIGRALLRRETVRAGGRLVLVAGPWARHSPRMVNPSYFSPRAFAALRRATGDRRFAELTASSYALTAALTRSPRQRLAPDWAQLGRDGAIRRSGPPAKLGAAAVHSYDAVRLPLRLAEACDRTGRRLAARARTRGVPPAARYADGRAAGPNRHPAATVGAAAAAHAAGDDEAADRLLDAAAAQDREHPTYYGAALVALGRVKLQTGLLGRCG